MTPLALSESLSEMVNAIIERLMEATGADAALILVGIVMAAIIL